MLDPSPPPSVQDTSGAPPPSSVHPRPPKKRRVTISGAPALNTDVRLPPDPTSSTPISPVVIGFTVQRDNPDQVEQVRSMLTVKQKQKALIEQRRGSVVGITTIASNTMSEDRSTKSTPPAPSNVSRAARRSPNAGTTSSRRISHAPAPTRPVTPPAPATQFTPAGPNGGHHQSLPPPPISFARRRATQLGAGGKRKPADIVISPREDQTPEQFAPSIQSAPAIPHAGRGGPFQTSMMIPRLPSVLGGGADFAPRMRGNVPPTPTRLGTLQSSQAMRPIPGISGIAGRSPPNASIAISSNLVPPTPSSLQHPSYSSDKSAFLAPFEVFYDALNDSKQMKTWLSEQLQRSNVLMQTLTQQQEKMQETVEALVEKRTAPMKAEIASLHKKVEELEDALRGGRRLSDPSKSKPIMRNGAGPTISESYTFPPVDRERERLDRSDRRIPSPGWGQEPMDTTDDDGRRPSLSGLRRDSGRSNQSQRQPSEDAKAFSSPPMPFRDSGSGFTAPKPFRHNSTLGPHRSPRIPPPTSDKEVSDGSRREDRRNSIVMSPPEGPDERDS